MGKLKRIHILLLILLLVIAGSFFAMYFCVPIAHPPKLPNFHQVDTGLYRGAQPTAEGFKELEKMGIKTVVCLRAEHSDKELVSGTKLQLKAIPLNTWDVQEKDIVAFLKIATDKSKQPVFVHCQHGADRTGTMCAAYRMVVQNWTKEEAIKEMKKEDFGYHTVWFNLPELLEKLPVKKVKQKIQP